jgi:uncharacterized protein YdaU (DUF1376 family)
VGNLKWYKRDPRAALAGMMALTLEQRGAYNTLIDLIYCHDGAVADDPKYLAKVMGCDVRVWKRLRSELLAAGKIYQNGPTLRNARADAECDTAKERIAALAHARLAAQQAAQLRASCAVRSLVLVQTKSNGYGSTSTSRKKDSY